MSVTSPDFFSEVRLSAVVRLLGVLMDGLPLPSRAALSASGFAHRVTVRESCPDCLVNGFRSRDCETCGGRGYLEGVRVRDPYDTGEASGWFASSAARHEREHARDAEVDRLGVQVAPPAGSELDVLASTGPEGWEVERARLRSCFHVAELEVALERLAVVDVEAHGAVFAVHVYGWLPDVGRARRLAERGVVTLSPWLPERLRAPLAAGRVSDG